MRQITRRGLLSAAAWSGVISMLTPLTKLFAVSETGTQKASGIIGLSTQALQQPDSPVQVLDPSVYSNPVTRSVRLTFQLLNKGPDPLKSFTICVVLFDENGRVKGGQLRTLRAAVQHGTHPPVTVRLSNLVYASPVGPYTRFVVGIVAWTSRFQSWRVTTPLSDVVDAMQDSEPLEISGSTLVVPTTPPPPGGGPPPPECGPDWCPVDCAAQFCEEICKTSGGVKSCSCTASTCSCSVTCNN